MDFFVGNETELKSIGKKGMRKQFFARTIGIKPFRYFRLRYVLRSLIKIVLFPFRNIIFDDLNQLGTDEDKSTHCALIIHNDWFPEFFDSKIWSHLINVKFEDYEFPVFEDYDYFLTQIYGDYMTPPPKEFQVSVHGIEAYMK